MYSIVQASGLPSTPPGSTCARNLCDYSWRRGLQEISHRQLCTVHLSTDGSLDTRRSTCQTNTDDHFLSIGSFRYTIYAGPRSRIFQRVVPLASPIVIRFYLQFRFDVALLSNDTGVPDILHLFWIVFCSENYDNELHAKEAILNNIFATSLKFQSGVS